SLKAECVRNDQGIVDLLLIDIGLTDENQWRSRLGSKQRFHSSQRHWLVLGYKPPLPISGGKQLKYAEDQTGRHSRAHENTSKLDELAPQQIERTDRCHHERAGDHRTAHVVRILPPRPWVQHQRPKAGKLDGAVRGFDVAD